MNALLALRPAKPLGVHFRHPCLACPSRCTNFWPFTEFIICQLSTVTQSLNSLQIVYDKHYNISGGASSSPTKSEGDSADAKQTVLWKEVSEVVIFEG